MGKEGLALLLLVAGVLVGIVFVIRKASTNEDDWAEYEKVTMGETAASVRARLPAAGPEITSQIDARTSGYGSAFREIVELQGVMMIVVPSREDVFVFGFDKDGRCVYKNFLDH